MAHRILVAALQRGDEEGRVLWHAVDDRFVAAASSILRRSDWLQPRKTILPGLILGGSDTAIQTRSWVRRGAWRVWRSWQLLRYMHLTNPLEAGEFIDGGSWPSRVVLEGQFQAYEPVRELLEISANPELVLGEALKMRIRNEDPIAIHMRLTDFLQPDILSSHGALPLNYYREALNRVTDTERRPIWIFSDDYPGAYSRLASVLARSMIVEAPRTSSDLEALTLLAACRTKILSNSTFSWWAGYLSSCSGEVIAPDPLTLDINGTGAAAPWWTRISTSYVRA